MTSAPCPGFAVTPQVCLVEPIGKGAMGSVWRADHRALRTEVAVKFISDELVLADSAALARFHREATTAAQIKNPHVVQTFDAGITDAGTPYIVMEYLEGENVSERIERTGWLSFGLTARMVKQVASALSSAHRMGIIHRDIKPDNIYLTPSDEGVHCKVLDFGIAKEIHKPSLRGLTAAGSTVGTPEFMSPEQMRDGTEDTGVDLWALSVVTYCALCATLPFDGPTLGALCIRIMAGEFTPVSAYRSDLPEGLDDWFRKAFNPDPAERFADAKDLAVSFAALADDAGFGDNARTGGLSPPTAPSLILSRPAMAAGDLDEVASSATEHEIGALIAPRRSRMPLVLGAAAVALLGVAIYTVSNAGDEGTASARSLPSPSVSSSSLARGSTAGAPLASAPLASAQRTSAARSGRATSDSKSSAVGVPSSSAADAAAPQPPAPRPRIPPTVATGHTPPPKVQPPRPLATVPDEPDF
jgi:eukaryotic-like serine/threonine-protein kinase